jgi:hypothetical protein
VLGTLSEREAGVVSMRFGLTGGQPKTLGEIGKVYGVTRERIRQIESKTMAKLRHPSRSKVCPVGFDKQTEMLPGRMMDPLDAMRWFTGERKLELAGAAPMLRQPRTAELSTTSLMKYHDELISRLRMKKLKLPRRQPMLLRPKLPSAKSMRRSLRPL